MFDCLYLMFVCFWVVVSCLLACCLVGIVLNVCGIMLVVVFSVFCSADCAGVFGFC